MYGPSGDMNRWGRAAYSENQFRAKLHGARISRGVDLTIRTAGNVRARERGEVRVVEDVENFPSQLDRLGFAEANTL